MLVRQLLFVTLFIGGVLGIILLLIPKSTESRVEPLVKSSSSPEPDNKIPDKNTPSSLLTKNSKKPEPKKPEPKKPEPKKPPKESKEGAKESTDRPKEKDDDKRKE
jgi:colicin import membrane protein